MTGKPNTKVVVRPMEPEDIGTVLEIDRKITGKKRAVTYADLITGNLGGELDLSFVAEINSQACGFILARRAYIGEPVMEIGLIQILGVDPEYQRQGIATKLVDMVLETSKEKGLTHVRTMLNDRDSLLQGFFAHMDFRRGQLIDYTKTL